MLYLVILTRRRDATVARAEACASRRVAEVLAASWRDDVRGAWSVRRDTVLWESREYVLTIRSADRPEEEET